MKDHLIFDTTDANTIIDSDNVGAFVRAANGDLITDHSLNAGANKHLDVYAALADGSGNAISSTDGALDVNLKSPISVNTDIDGFYVAGAGNNPTPDSAGVIFHTRAVAPAITDQIQRSTVGGLNSILAADLSKVHAIDANSFIYAINDNSGDAELLAIDNATGGLIVSVASMPAISTNDAALADIAVVSKADSLAAAGTAEKVVAANLAARKYLFVYNNFNRKIFIGGSDVDATNGFPISPGSYIELRAGNAVDVYYDSLENGATIRTLELS